MIENDQTSISRTRKWSHVIYIALIPIIAQIALFFWIANWAQGAGPSRGMIGLFSFIILLVAVPVAMAANIIIARMTPGLHLFWMILLALVIATLLPVIAGVSILLAP